MINLQRGFATFYKRVTLVIKNNSMRALLRRSQGVRC